MARPRRLQPSALIVLLALITLGAAGCSDERSENAGGGGKDKTKYDCHGEPQECAGNFYRIGLYCQYGAVSRAQLDQCERHVTIAQINRLDTNAARYSSFELLRCLGDSGPFCERLPEPGPPPS